MMKKTLCLMMSAIMLLTMLVLPVSADQPTASEYYTDVFLTDSYYDAAMFLYQQSIMGETATGTFSPNGTLTRAQIVTILWRMADYPEPNGPTINFTDILSTAYYYDAVQWACSQSVGITNGYSATTFCPNLTLTHQEALTFIYRFMCYCGYITDDPFYFTLFSFSDLTNKSSFSNYAKRAIGWAYDVGVFTNSSLVGTDNCLRKNAAEYLYALYQSYQNKYGLCVVNTDRMNYAQTAGTAMQTLFNHFGVSTQYSVDITKTQFASAMSSKFSQAKPLDTCYIYCLSHGGTNGLALFTETSNRYLTPAYLRSLIDNYYGTFVVFVAGCNTGTYITRDGDNNRDSGDYFDADGFVTGLMNNLPKSGELGGADRIKVLCSSEKDESSYHTISRATKYWCLGSGYNLTTNTFVDAEADESPYGNEDGKISLCELFDYSYDKVLVVQPNQHIACSAPDDLFVIFR